MNQPRYILLSIALIALTTGCNVYSRRQGEFNAGPVDPVNFPPEYLGTTSATIDRTRAGAGSFFAVGAFANNTPIEYFRFSFTPSQTTGTPPNDIRVQVNGNPNPRVPTPSAYVFNPGPTSPASPSCKPPDNYAYDVNEGDIPFNEQGPVFTALPNATYALGSLPTSTYVPIVAEVGVSVTGNPACQDVKSEDTLLTRSDFSFPKTDLPLGKQTGTPDGKYLAWAVIDPGSPVYHFRPSGVLGNVNFVTGAGLLRNDPAIGLGLQRWGWFNHYLLAFLDGGYVPTTTSGTTVTIKTQRIYYPSTTVSHGGTLGTAAGALGRGYDVLQYPRSDANYSPVCEVRSYAFTPGAAPSALPRDAAAIELLGTAAGTPPFIYCLQVQ